MISVISLISFWSSEQQRLTMSTVEAFDPSLKRIQTIDQLVQELEPTRGDPPLNRVLALEHLLRDRFFYGYARYAFSENWVAWLAAKTIHPDLDAKTDPREIIESPWAACSQQAIVVQAVLRRWNMPYASVAFPGHFAAAVKIEGGWYVVDPWEPLERDRSRLYSLSAWQSPRERAKFLGAAAQVAWEPDLRAKPPRLTHVNESPAPTMAWFQPLTEILSRWLWVPAFLWLIMQTGALLASSRSMQGKGVSKTLARKVFWRSAQSRTHGTAS